MVAHTTIELIVDAGVATIALNRPDKLNSFNEQMHGELRAALAELRDDSQVRCLLLTGRGRGFCAGQDLGERNMQPGSAPPDLGATIERNYNPLVRALRSMPKPIVCAVNGVAAGAGASVALACDLVLAARSAKFVQAFSKIGLLPDTGGTWLLPRLAGSARAAGLALLGDALPAEQAAQWGLIWKCVDDDKLAGEADALARHLATQPTRALAAIKQALQLSTGNGLDAQLDLERDLQRELGRSEDYREGVTAFLAKRAPQFKGR
jgi:2-(1,2-epoxy-1,2-dihydrophenyl)acetyl-CoA isomerase